MTIKRKFDTVNYQPEMKRRKLPNGRSQTTSSATNGDGVALESDGLPMPRRSLPMARVMPMQKFWERALETPRLPQIAPAWTGRQWVQKTKFAKKFLAEQSTVFHLTSQLEGLTIKDVLGLPPVLSLRPEVYILRPMDEEQQKEEATGSIKALGIANAPTHWNNRGAAWTIWEKYHPIRDYKSSHVMYIEKYDSYINICEPNIPSSEHNLAYKKLLDIARPLQVRYYYVLHCQRLEDARHDSARIVPDNRECLMQAQGPLLKFDKSRAPNANKKAKRLSLRKLKGRRTKVYALGAKDRAYTREIEDLIQACEELLQADPKFVPIDWRPFATRQRWQDGKRGWTGLSDEEVGEQAAGDDEDDLDEDAVLRVQFARSFPRKSDLRRTWEG